MRPLYKWVSYGVGAVLASEVAAFIYRKWRREREIFVSIITRDSEDFREQKGDRALLYKDLDPANCLRHIMMLERLIDSAKFSINICMYIFTAQKLAQALIRAKERGVKVRVILEKSMENSSNSQRIPLLKANIAVRIWSEFTFHHKFMLIDVPDFDNENAISDIQDVPFNIPNNGLVLMGSLNFTLEALTKNHESIIITSHADTISYFTRNFFTMWGQLDMTPSQ